LVTKESHVYLKGGDRRKGGGKVKGTGENQGKVQTGGKEGTVIVGATGILFKPGGAKKRDGGGAKRKK